MDKLNETMWDWENINVAWLDGAADAGKSVTLVGQDLAKIVQDIDAGDIASFTHKEVAYLIKERGYRVVGNALVAP